jgi:hypothetical protein
MSFVSKWRNQLVDVAVVGMLVAAGVASSMASSDINEAAEAQVQIGALSKAAADFELAWFQAMGADALAATGQAPDEAQGFYDGAINLYNSSKAVLASAGIPEIDQALAASDQGLAVMNQAFAGTMAYAAAGDVASATANHMNGTVVLYGNVDPAVEGLTLVAQAADAQLVAEMNSGASKLRLMSTLSFVVAAFGAAFAGWSAWSIYRKEGSAGSSHGEQASFERAA